ncbi:LysM peptidoglycan-binding domain-containing protein [Synechococcus sp. Nb3U1]|uniref:LysM peptidoglycan-binding domain-containing protein n=1 Tax=Synechococcus sp. Nb3U1 TaxID=1914529 RepID=UPI001F25EEB0|nr:LysM peptidoglycan-binding domain-containing protein [Synechococcus sp. Nb3U1]MCF2972367.1 LysM peptidoglycan-binding domain-containing protein [Synechococcus sp. Nb3U1]
MRPTLSNPRNGELDSAGAAVSTFSSPALPVGIPSEGSLTAQDPEISQDPSVSEAPQDAEGSRLEWVAASPPMLPKPRLAGFALSLGLTGLVWLLKLELDPSAESLETLVRDPQQAIPDPLSELAQGTSDKSNKSNASLRRTYPVWANGLLLMLGLAGAATLQQRQLNRQPLTPLPPVIERIPPSVHTLSGALQQNYDLKKAQLREAFQEGAIPTGEGPKGILEHEVQPGETLWQLTQMYQLDAAAITVSNGIQANTPLEPGQTLWIPSQPGLVYTVKQGDTLEDVANRYQVSQQQIIAATPLNRPEYLRIGQRLLIPGDVSQLINRQKEMIAAQKAREEEERRRQEEEALRRAEEQARQEAEQQRLAEEAQRQAEQERQTQAALLASGSLTHTVGSGDTIERIAARYGVTQRSIIQANNLRNPHWLRIGQRLAIPAPGTQPTQAPAPPAQPQPQAQPVPAAPPQARSSSGFVWPVSGQITSGFGYRRGRLHAGVDIPGPVGSPIVAVMEGTVIFAGNGGDGYGNRVDIRHPNGLVTRYAHGHQIYVSNGQYVQQGQTIMSRGSTGWSTGPHLHFEVRPGGGAPVDPRPYLP